MFIKKNYVIQTEIPTSGTPTASDFKRYIDSLQVDINNLHRELTYWDLYKITHVIQNDSDLASIVNTLSPGESAVINLTSAISTVYNGITYTRGDIIVKLIDNTLQHIKSISSGIYEPSISFDTDTNNYKITYAFTTEVPVGDAATKDFAIETTSSSSIYDVYGTINNNTKFAVRKISNTTIRPVIRFYTIDEEIIDIPFTLTIVTESNVDYWQITARNNDFGLATYIQVK